MKIILIHGNASVAILDKIQIIKKDFSSDQITVLDGKQVNWSNIVMTISSPQLFVDKQLFIIENMDEAITLEKLVGTDSTTVILKISKQLAANSKLLKEAMAQKAEVISLTEKDEVSVFPFLDSLAEKNSRSFVQLEQLFESFGGQYILTMIFFMLRRLVAPPKNLPPFVLKKMENQKKNFSLEKIRQSYKEAILTDFKIKNGLIEERMGITLLVQNILNV
jgi:DNA polymerase III delta subunit